MWLLVVLSCRENIGIADVGSGEGEPCEDHETCASGLVCAHDGTCQVEDSPGTYAIGEECLHAEECQLGLICDSDGQCAEPGAEGTGQADDACEDDGDCALGLVCSDGLCEDLGVPYWEGVTCEADSGDFRIYTEVPSLPEEDTIEFYRMPFASDARVDGDGHLELSGHSSPGGAVDSWLAAALRPSDLGLTPTVLFRASGRLDTDSVRGLSDDDTLSMADLDQSSEDYGFRGSFTWRVSPGRGRYHCENWIGVQTFPGVPLAADGSYGVWLTSGVQSATGESASRDEDLDALLSEETPTDARLLVAWNAWSPLRDFFSRNGVDPDTVVGAAVLSTGNPAARVRSIEDRLEGEAVSSDFPELVDCASSPCEGGCADDVTELHGQLALPIFQDEAGAWDWDTFGNPYLRGEELACVAMTTPGAGEDWPVVVVVQDEGAGFRDWIDTGLARELAEAGFAAISVELPHHGTRGRGDGSLYDLEDPERWLGDRLQLVADLVQLSRVLEGREVHAVGHGVGGEIALGWASTRRDVSTLVVGGVGGGLTDRLLEVERDGVPVHYRLQVMLADSKLGSYHPMLALMQYVQERADPLVWAEDVWKNPPTATEPSHVLHLYGAEDEVVGAPAQQALQRALGLPTLEPVLVDFEQSTVTGSASRNLLNDRGDRITGASVQLDAGHDAIWSDEGRDYVVRFLASSLEADEPTIE
ncbi:MAG TPA: alpha/beta fold hydrolase [Myxococcota bacterium]|nr:alpha/beta fold hydrolase [Myxococcota bacterium]